jgi:hypothetical protein
VNNQNEITSELLELGLNKLARHRKNLSENTPEHDFDSICNSVMSKIIQERKIPPQKKGVVVQMRTLLNIAASLLLIAGLSFGFLLLRNQARYAAMREEAILEEYLMQYADYDRNLFYEMVIDNLEQDQNLAQLSEDYYLIEYVLESSEIQGMEPEDYLIQPLVNHQP